MTQAAESLLVRALREPQATAGLAMPEWELLIRQARHADLLARIAVRALAPGMPAPPPGVREHLGDVLVLAQAQRDEVRREVEFLAQALAPLAVPVTLMKGAAYLMAGNVAGAGRLFTDVDIMVPKARLPEVEAALMQHGWATTHHTPYDQRYYRLWMHELPPMQHLQRQTVVDVHHAILPETARLQPDAQAILAAAQPLPGDPRVQVLAPVDRVLHSITHLLHNEELSHGLRDLSDIDLLLREFAAEAAFWPELLARAAQLGLRRPLYYGLRQAQALLRTPVPAAVTAAIADAAPPPPLRSLMDAIWRRALAAQHPSCAEPGTAAALGALYLHAHWLRMPPALLLRHLATKAWMQSTNGDRAAEQAADTPHP
ncbi:conserved hypothetical protein [Rubrivivax sp. A210]|uniref:nucleotidyltransferase domain-containing protein n=1 Tax=Rubrivivax sp. A210 TaxID=2772301 RepID=UPI001917E342|nr:nucleotidyltransferase family protein [Rubrivivax sp. A210]CAD5375193.1 conserved hypothetical protein [Rubrivivax sp. A210]